MPDCNDLHSFFESLGAVLDRETMAYLHGLRVCGRTRFQAIMDALNQGEQPVIHCLTDPGAPPPPVEVLTEGCVWTARVERDGKAWAFGLGDLGDLSLFEYRYAGYLIVSGKYNPAQAAAARKLAQLPGAQAWF